MHYTWKVRTAEMRPRATEEQIQDFRLMFRKFILAHLCYKY